MHIRLTTLQSYQQAAWVLASAFNDDPVSKAVYRNFTPERRVKALTVDFTAELVVCLRRGLPLEMEHDNKIVAATVIYPPDTYPLPAWDQWLLLVKSILGNGVYDLRSWLRWQAEVGRFHPTESHYYLEYIGVDPEYQGRAIGTTLLQRLVVKADEEQVGCYLENANPRNLSFYQRLGFEIWEEKEVIGLPTWFMWRHPGKRSF